jgi:hypothetical protein
VVLVGIHVVKSRREKEVTTDPSES